MSDTAVMCELALLSCLTEVMASCHKSCCQQEHNFTWLKSCLQDNVKILAANVKLIWHPVGIFCLNKNSCISQWITLTRICTIDPAWSVIYKYINTQKWQFSILNFYDIGKVFPVMCHRDEHICNYDFTLPDHWMQVVLTSEFTWFVYPAKIIQTGVDFNLPFSKPSIENLISTPHPYIIPQPQHLYIAKAMCSFMIFMKVHWNISLW